jgi:hypothetical protein
LEQLGFTAHRLSASTRLPNGRFGPEIEHLAVLVDLDGEQWLADVGYSEPTSFGPLKITTEVQLQDGFEFRMVRDGEWWVLDRARDCVLGALVQHPQAALHDRQHPAGRVRTELLRSPTSPRRTQLGRTQPPLNPGRFKVSGHAGAVH